MSSYIKFIGDYSKLKPMGFEFQRLYASNYMQWHKDGYRVWKKGAELTIDKVSNSEGEFFKLLLGYREHNTPLTLTRGVFVVWKNWANDELSFTPPDERDDLDWSSITFTTDELTFLMSLYDKGFISFEED